MELKYALVTGSSSGLGQSILEYLLDQGYFVFSASRNPIQFDESNFLAIECDVGNEDQVIAMFEDIAAHTESIDLFVNCAGIFESTSLVTTESETFLEMFKTNSMGAFHLIKYGVDFFKENETHFISFSSVASKRGLGEMSSYSASKAALEKIIESARYEFYELGVRFTTFVLGAVDTPLWDKIERIERETMLSADDFMNVFTMVEKSPSHVQFDEIRMTHRDSPLL